MKKEKYRVELGKVFIYEEERNAYVFAGRLNGKTLTEWIYENDDPNASWWEEVMRK